MSVVHTELEQTGSFTGLMCDYYKLVNKNETACLMADLAVHCAFRLVNALFESSLVSPISLLHCFCYKWEIEQRFIAIEKCGVFVHALMNSTVVNNHLLF